MGQAFVVDTQQSAPRGGDKFYSANWFMASALHTLGSGSLSLTAMISLDPATVTNRRYPLLFQTGETAFGRPLGGRAASARFSDGLERSVCPPAQPGYDAAVLLRAGGRSRTRTGRVPSSRVGIRDSRRPRWAITGRIPRTLPTTWRTVAVRHKWLRLEASGFYGTEPDENRWNIDWGRMNSYSARFSVTPNANWLAQVSAGRLARPERQEEGDVVRTTASLQYSRPLDRGTSWSTSLIWGRNHQTATQRNPNSWLFETLYPVTRRNFLTGRLEMVDKDELFANQPSIEEQPGAHRGKQLPHPGVHRGIHARHRDHTRYRDGHRRKCDDPIACRRRSNRITAAIPGG